MSQSTLFCVSLLFLQVLETHIVAKRQERPIICLQDDTKLDFPYRLPCLLTSTVGALWSIKSDKLQRKQSGCDSQGHLHFASTVPECMRSFSRVVNMPVFTETADVIFGGKWHFSEWKVVFWCIFSTLFLSMPRERWFNPETVALRACWD